MALSLPSALLRHQDGARLGQAEEARLYSMWVGFLLVWCGGGKQTSSKQIVRLPVKLPMLGFLPLEEAWIMTRTEHPFIQTQIISAEIVAMWERPSQVYSLGHKFLFSLMSRPYLQTLGCALSFHFCLPYSLRSFLGFYLLSSCSWTEPRTLASGGQETRRLGLPRFTSLASSLSAHWSPYVTPALSEPTWPQLGLRKSWWMTTSDDRAPVGFHSLLLKPSTLHDFYPSMSFSCVCGLLQAVPWWCL